jgi:hypothetical protein
MTEEDKIPLPSSLEYETMLKDLRDIRKGLTENPSQENLEFWTKEAIKLITSPQFGNFVTLSKIYDSLEKLK